MVALTFALSSLLVLSAFLLCQQLEHIDTRHAAKAIAKVLREGADGLEASSEVAAPTAPLVIDTDAEREEWLKNGGNVSAEEARRRQQTLENEIDRPKLSAHLVHVPFELEANWSQEKSIAHGGYGKVYRFRSKIGIGHYAAFKVAVPDNNKRKKKPEYWWKASAAMDIEAANFMGLRNKTNSKHICSMEYPKVGTTKVVIGTALEKYPRWMLLEWFNQGDLFHWREKRTRSMPMQMLVMWHATMGVRDMHEAGYVHADIKDRNILIRVVEDDGRNPGASDGMVDKAAICDVGLSRKLLSNGSHLNGAGTPGYRSIEVVLCGAKKIRAEDEEYCQENIKDDPAVDVWSLGIAICRQYFDRSPIEELLDAYFTVKYDKAKIDQKRKALKDAESWVRDKMSPEAEGLEKEIVNSIADCLIVDRAKRSTMAKLEARMREFVFRLAKDDESTLLPKAIADAEGRDVDLRRRGLPPIDVPVPPVP